MISRLSRGPDLQTEQHTRESGICWYLRLSFDSLKMSVYRGITFTWRQVLCPISVIQRWISTVQDSWCALYEPKQTRTGNMMFNFFFFPRWGGEERVIGRSLSYLKIQLRGSTLSRIALVKVREVPIVSASFNLTWLNSCCYRDQRFWHVNEACGSFSLVLTH